MPDLIPSPHLIPLPPRPQMPTAVDEERAVHQASRSAMLHEDFDDVIEAWLENYIEPEVLEQWGQPDTATNPLVHYCRQLTTPGRYFMAPRVSHTEEVEALGDYLPPLDRLRCPTSGEPYLLRKERGSYAVLCPTDPSHGSVLDGMLSWLDPR